MTTYSYTGGFQSFTASIAGTYAIDAYGASGGTGAIATGSNSGYGGEGVGIGGTFVLSAGEVLTIAVGGVGQSPKFVQASSGGGGGGGSFVTIASTNSDLLIAGGGGGGDITRLRTH